MHLTNEGDSADAPRPNSWSEDPIQVVAASLPFDAEEAQREDHTDNGGNTIPSKQPAPNSFVNTDPHSLKDCDSSLTADDHTIHHDASDTSTTMIDAHEDMDMMDTLDLERDNTSTATSLIPPSPSMMSTLLLNESTVSSNNMAASSK